MPPPSRKPLIAFTPGEPAGIGPDLAIMLAQTNYPERIVAIADPELLSTRATLLGLPFKAISPGADRHPGEMEVMPVRMAAEAQPGELNTANAPYVIETLKLAADGCMSGEFAAMVTGPVHKGVINEAGIPFTGHTELLAEHADVDDVVMMLATDEMRVPLVTTHLPLKNVSTAITGPHLEKVIRILYQDMMEKFGLPKPVIHVCGLNPHAGEGGHLGREEIDVIEPVLNKLRGEGMNLIGPLPADTAFARHRVSQADATLAMYHDQGLPVLKYAGFGKAVNITLGLPFIRTSVDHGTALDLAGSGKADMGSLLVAIETARQMIQAGQS